MAWIEFHPTRIIRLKKFHDLRTEMGWSSFECLGALGIFWGHTLEVQESGDVTGWTGSYIEAILGFRAQVSERFLESLKSHGWIDPPNAKGRELIHNWLDYAGTYLRSKYSGKNREKLEQIWALYGKEYGARIESIATQSNLDKIPIVPNLTLPKEKIYKKEKIRAGPFIKPTPEEVDKYAQAIRANVDGAKFCNFYESKGWLVGKNPMKDWHAAVRLWASNAPQKAMSIAEIDKQRQSSWLKRGLCGNCGGKWETIENETRCYSCGSSMPKITFKNI